MHDPARSAGSSSAVLRAALLDYSHAPGKYQVGSRQPQLLFSSLRDVLQIAVGREGEGVDGSQEAISLRDAARFFVRSALLFPGADHYALLGVERTAGSADLKDRYRLLMRLLHPDFSGPGAGSWPADSAVRVNRAYDTLSSAVERRLYDETLVPVHGIATANNPEPRRPRPIVNSTDRDNRQSHFKILATVCALASVGLVAAILSATGSHESAQLVQRAHIQPGPVSVVMKDAGPSPVASPVARLQEALAQFGPAPATGSRGPVDLPVPRAPTFATRERPPSAPATETPAPAPAPVPRPLEIAEPRLERIQSARAPQAGAPVAPPEPKPEIMLAAAPVAAPPAAPPAPAVVGVTPMPAAPLPRPQPRSGPTLVEAQPLLSQLLQVMESGRGERILNLLDAEVRGKPSAQALSRQYDTIVDGARPVRVSHVEFKAEPGDGKLLVVGYFRVLAGEQTIGSLGKKMVLRAEFASREGNVVITALSGELVN